MDLIRIAGWIWVTCAIVFFVVGTVTLARKQIALPWLRGSRWQPFGWAQVFMGIFCLFESIPRFVGASKGVVFLFAGAAIAPAAAGIILNYRAYSSNPQRPDREP